MSDPANAIVKNYAPGTPEREALTEEIAHQRANPRHILPIIDGQKVDTGTKTRIAEPHAHARTLGSYASAGQAETEAAIAAAMRARGSWSAMAAVSRRAVFLRAADLLAGPFNAPLVAATMLGQSKSAYQAEIDASAELIDFLRFNVAFSAQLEGWQPQSTAGEYNRLEFRPLDGFVFVASPFNFTAIAGNLCIAPMLMGNTVIWKPSERSIYSAAFVMDLFEAAGVPPGVINMLPTDDPKIVGDTVLSDPDLAGIHFTGSTGIFDQIWRSVGANIASYRAYPRLVGETGGKDFVLAHTSADVDALVTALVRGAFDYQGQKCSAASRAYIPKSIMAEVADKLGVALETASYGDVSEFSNFGGAVIDKRAFDTASEFIDHAKRTPGHELLSGGEIDDSEGYFVTPTVIECDDPHSRLMVEEIFAPILAIHTYDDDDLDSVVQLVDRSTPYALTGAIFASDQAVIDRLNVDLRDAAGNFYINDKPTGAVVGRQPFGGGRRSGTNDKAGSPYNLLRWASPRTVKETTVPPTDHRYPHMGR